MPAFNFHRKFADAVSRGQKRMTIRAERKDYRRWSVGTPVSLYTGMRSSGCTLLGRSTLVRRSDIQISASRVWVDGELLPQNEVEQLARSDGFESSTEFIDWFSHPRQVGDFVMFYGVLYAWGELQ